MKPVYLAVAAVVLFVLSAVPAAAQQAPCHAVSPTDRVVITTVDEMKVRGTILCLTDQSLLLLRDGATSETPLSQIRRIETRSDPVWDGAVKGAAVPLVLWAIFCHDCGSADIWMKNVASYAIIGATWDALQRNTKTIYAGQPGPSIGWRVRF